LIPSDNTNNSNYFSGNGVTLDSTTGLEWQQVDNNTLYTYLLANDYCQNLVLDGKTDWRLPTAKELFSIVNLATFSPSINGSAFPATNNSDYWTISEANKALNTRIVAFFNIGELITLFETSESQARCVRSNGSNTSIQLLKDNADGTVKDEASGLFWQQEDDNTTRNQADAHNYCDTLTLAGSNDWRLPEAKELFSIADFRNSSPIIDGQVFPDTDADLYWSATINASNSSGGWAIDFGDGQVDTRFNTSEHYVRCVR